MTTDSDDPRARTDEEEGCQFSDKEDGDKTEGTVDSKPTPTKEANKYDPFRVVQRLKKKLKLREEDGKKIVIMKVNYDPLANKSLTIRNTAPRGSII